MENNKRKKGSKKKIKNRNEKRSRKGKIKIYHKKKLI
jgi:hypothetical protein